MCQGPLSKDEIIGVFQNNHYNFKKTLRSLVPHNFFFFNLGGILEGDRLINQYKNIRG